MKNLFRYDPVSMPEYDLKNHIRKWHKEHNVYHGQYDAAIEDFFRGLIVLEYHRDKKRKPHFAWRLTYPLWALTWLVLITAVCPINWIVTGSYALDDQSRIFSWVRPWYRKLFP